MEHSHPTRTERSTPTVASVLRRAALPAVLACIAVANNNARAASFFWSSAGATYNWSEGANWSTGVHPANDGSSDLLFGALNVSYLTNADIPGSIVAGGEIRGMTFLS